MDLPWWKTRFDSPQEWYEMAMIEYNPSTLRETIASFPLSESLVADFTTSHLAKFSFSRYSCIIPSNTTIYTFEIVIDKKHRSDSQKALVLIHEVVHGVYRASSRHLYESIEKLIQSEAERFYEGNTNYCHELLQCLQRKYDRRPSKRINQASEKDL